jgi:putative aldouronate transport system permease protein
MLLPGIVVLLLFAVYPMLGLTIAFQNYNPTKGFFGSEWVGLENFRYMFEIPDSYKVFRNTIVIALAKMIANLGFALTFALLLNELRKVWFKRVVQTVVYFPHFISWVLFGGILSQIFSIDGVLNTLLASAGMKHPILFLGSNEWFRPIVVASDVWKEFGFSAIIFLAALTGINPVLYEAAEMDGAGRWLKMRHVTLPGVKATIILVGTLSLQNVLNAGFEQILNLYNPLVYETGDIIDTYVYRIGFLQSQYELATAVGLLKSVVSLVLIVLSYRLASKFANYRIF